MNLMRIVVAPAVAGLVGVVLATVPGAGAAPGEGPEPVQQAPSGGSMSGGDPYFPLDGNGGYDVLHYRIATTYRPGPDRLTGRTVLSAVAHKKLTRFHLDLALTPDSVQVDGVSARFSKPRSHELRVVPSRALEEGTEFRVRVEYHGRPAATRAAGLSPFFHAPGEGLALGEPQIGPWWFAANETPKDKATYDISVRVPKGREAVSNGELVSRSTKGGWTTWRWEMTDPMVSYLAFFLAGDLQLRHGKADGRPYVYAVSERLGAAAREQSFDLLAETPEIVSWLEGHFGEYPFTSTGGVVAGIDNLDFALENASRPVYPYVGGPSTWNVLLLVHEQAHQWFGDDVSLRRWRDLWLNEGFATYAEWLYAEEHGGSTVDQELEGGYGSRSPSSSFWDVQVSDPGADDMWGDAVYQRGGMMLAALRNRIGAEEHSELLRRWVAERREGHGTGTAFRTLAETVSGEELGAFFAEWLDETNRPDHTTANGFRS
ncbi:MAG TPA: M1 family metallopeptidase [Marmoricola sp.]|nr:M1 family metallopeptidase [Marmoricola sp.]